jgi:hypothetical protein
MIRCPSAWSPAILAATLVLTPLAAQRGATHPDFLSAVRCGDCHSAVESANALWNATGDDVSPYTLWRGTMMANAFRDPYWRAQVSNEVAANPEKRAEIEGLCITCHSPIAHHRARHAGGHADSIEALLKDDLAQEGVSCTVCHQSRPDGFGTPATFGGKLDVRPDGVIWGPFEEPAVGPMLAQTGYTPRHGPHLRDAGLCASCHTLHTSHVPGGAPFPEQSPFLEWQNSRYAVAGGEHARTCQQCHMPEQGTMKIARNPGGFDFNIDDRSGVRGHAFVGGNAFMLDLMRKNHKELGMKAPGELLKRVARATRQQLATRTATIAVQDAAVKDGRLEFAVKVTNETGHKLPTGYPARRAWLRVLVRRGNQVLFQSGAFGDDGKLAGAAKEHGLPHFDVIESPEQVQVYELVAHDVESAPTTQLTRMATRGKDNRLLPHGWLDDGPNVGDTAPMGLGDDADFEAGADLVHYRVKLEGASGAPLTIVAWFLYQPVPPAWVDALRDVDTEECKRFVRMYDAADKTPETLALTVKILE